MPIDYLVQRYIVIKSYSIADPKIGDIIRSTSNMPASLLDRFPHLLRPLEWYEYRAPEEMPEYILKITPGHIFDAGDVRRVRTWTFNKRQVARENLCGWLATIDAVKQNSFLYPAEGLIPSTKEEYEASKQYQATRSKAPRINRRNSVR